MKKLLFSFAIVMALITSISMSIPYATSQETLELYASVHIPNQNAEERGLAVDPIGGRVWYSNTGGGLFLVSMADILDGDPITPLAIQIEGIHQWYALAWDPVRDVIWAMDYNNSLQRIYSIDDDTYIPTFQFDYSNLPDNFLGEDAFLDGMGYDPVRDTLWFSEDFDPDVWEVSTTPGPGNTAQLVTYFDTNPNGGNSGTVTSFEHVWLTDPISEQVEMLTKDGTQVSVFNYPNPDSDNEEDMEFDYQTLKEDCLLWVIDRGQPASSKIEAYIIPSDRPVGGEILAVNVLSVLSPYLLILATIAITLIGILYKKRIH